MKVIKKGVMPDGTSIQIEDWSEDYSFHNPCDTVAAYPVAKQSVLTSHGFYPEQNRKFRTDFKFKDGKTAEKSFNDLINGISTLKDYIDVMDNPHHAVCL